VGAPPGTPPARAPGPAGGIHELWRWHPCPQSLAGTVSAQMAPNGVTPCPLLVTQLLRARCFRVPLLTVALRKMLEVGADFSGRLCVAQTGAAGEGYRRMDCGCSLNLFLPGWWDWGWTVPVSAHGAARPRLCRGMGQLTRQSSWRGGKAVAVPNQVALMFGPAAVPLACTSIVVVSEPSWGSAVSFGSPSISNRPWCGGSGGPACRCSQVSGNTHKLQLP